MQRLLDQLDTERNQIVHLSRVESTLGLIRINPDQGMGHSLRTALTRSKSSGPPTLILSAW